MSVWGNVAKAIGSTVAFLAGNRDKIVATSALISDVLGQHERYDQYNHSAKDQGPKPIRYNARLQHRKKKSQRKNWRKWRKKI